MKGGKISKLKKYLFMISILFLIVSVSHLTYRYLYSDAKLKPLNGGIVTEGLIGNVPSLNPLTPLSGNNEYVINLIYRSLSKYDIKENKIISDIANCDVSNLLSIECFLETEIKWSNGDKITTKDIKTTFETLKKSKVNPYIASLLKDTTIEEKENSIIFTNKNKDINFINVLFQPIVPDKVIANMSEDELKSDFSHINGIYSGKYIITNVYRDLASLITDVSLEKNTFYKGNKVFIEKIVLKIFEDTNSFLKNKDSVNIFNDKDNLIGISMPRMNNNKYILPQYISLYLNKEKIKNENLRNFILNKIDRDNLIKILGVDAFKPIYNPFLSEDIIKREPKDKNIVSILKNVGYFKKSELIKNYLEGKVEVKKIEKKTISDEITLNPESGTGVNKKTESGSLYNPNPLSGALNGDEESKLLAIYKKEVLEKFGGDSKLITSPDYIDKYNFVRKDDVLLEGITEGKVDNIYVNDYKLKSFTSGDKEFFYRIKKSLGNIKPGENSYKIYFEKDGKKELKEELIFIYGTSASDLTNRQEEFALKKAKEMVKNKKTEKKVVVKKDPIDKDKLEKLEALDDNSFYNIDLEKFSFELYYINSEKNIEQTALFVKSNLEKEGLEVNLNPISIGELSKIINDKEKLGNYDMIIAGINLGHFDYNIYSYYHSSQVKNGYNFSNLKKLSLDILLEELKGNTFTNAKTKQLEKKVLDILKNEQVVKVLYTPYLNNLVDKNIKDFKNSDYLYSKSSRYNGLDKAYVTEKKEIDFSNKNISGFFKYLFKLLNE